MMNKYIEIEMVPTACGMGGSFSTDASFCLDNFKAPFVDVEVKIDTGCSLSTIPVRRLKVSDTLCRTLKKFDIMNCVPYFLSYGVETGGQNHKLPVGDDEKMDCPAMKFEHGISNFTIGGVRIPKDKICLNYDRRGNILIGMDILKDWDIHIGMSKLTHRTILIACPSEGMCKEYSTALKMHFGIS